MFAHYGNTKHPIVLSFSDLSYWCFICDSYVVSEKLNQHALILDQKMSKLRAKLKNQEKLKNDKTIYLKSRKTLDEYVINAI